MDGGLIIERRLPVEWAPRQDFSPREITEWMQGNLLLLKALAGLETPLREGESEQGNEDLVRLEAKIDLTLALVAELLRRAAPLPSGTTVRLGSERIGWPANLTPGIQGLVSVYLSPHLPWPLRLPVEITASGEGWVEARLLHLTEEVQHWLDRTLFRHHRRELKTRRR